MRFPKMQRTLVLVLGSASALAACGDEEVFEARLGSTERLIDREAEARITSGDEGLDQLAVVGDIDGDGVDDAVVRMFHVIPSSFDLIEFGTSVYVLYGGGAVTGALALSSLPSLTGPGASGPGAFGGDVAPAGDVDGDGLADFFIGVARTPGCGILHEDDADMHSGAYLVYGSATRLAGATSLATAGVFLRDPRPCTSTGGQSGLGDLDGDGKADFAITTVDTGKAQAASEVRVFYGRGTRLTGVVDVVATADATISPPPPQSSLSPFWTDARAAGAGDVDGDGYGDFLLHVPISPAATDIRLVRGGAARLSGTLAVAALAGTEILDNVPCRMRGVGLFQVIRNGETRGAALGDLDGDGADDFSLLSCGASAAVHRVFYGRAGGFPAQLRSGDEDAVLAVSGAGASRIAGGDVDGDGQADVVVSDAGRRDGNGGVAVIRGAAQRLSGTIDPVTQGIVYVGSPQRARGCVNLGGRACVVAEEVGVDVGVGDLTGDGRLDILVSAPSDQDVAPKQGVAGSSLGHAYVVSPPVATNP